MKYVVKDVVCDYGVFEDEELVLVCNSKSNALLIKAIMEKDILCNKKDYVFDLNDCNDSFDKIN